MPTRTPAAADGDLRRHASICIDLHRSAPIARHTHAIMAYSSIELVR
jgi:hypothetical protein